ncbi:hypothetical protein LE181_04815 [Streptomyces sp. SCA3-4]|uniref:hypothetical protein n=1 Tax=Streptomyces sichuanensis TaxID=2871810 RepID=UPI001CE39DAF|nr:hypothetical protein [Streptomyces sichuanensis]MCA6091488.1 hypothetical protein [Streptomyces sichuanensis]
MKPVRRIATIAAATLMLALGSAVLATPAQADADVSLLGDLVTGHANSLVAVGALGGQLVSLPVSLAPVL